MSRRTETLHALQQIEKDGDYMSLDTLKKKEHLLNEEIEVLEKALVILLQDITIA